MPTRKIRPATSQVLLARIREQRQKLIPRDRPKRHASPVDEVASCLQETLAIMREDSGTLIRTVPIAEQAAKQCAHLSRRLDDLLRLADNAAAFLRLSKHP